MRSTRSPERPRHSQSRASCATRWTRSMRCKSKSTRTCPTRCANGGGASEALGGPARRETRQHGRQALDAFAAAARDDLVRLDREQHAAQHAEIVRRDRLAVIGGLAGTLVLTQVLRIDVAAGALHCASPIRVPGRNVALGRIRPSENLQKNFVSHRYLSEVRKLKIERADLPGSARSG